MHVQYKIDSDLQMCVFFLGFISTLKPVYSLNQTPLGLTDLFILDRYLVYTG
jgi:hypothetical protein